jgi:uncharacterized protein (TIGR02147 family)
MNYETYHDILKEEFEKRIRVNPSYSLRSFARDMEISAPRLSQILSKKQGLSLEAAKGLVKKLKLPAEKKEWFCHSVSALHSRSHKTKKESTVHIRKIKAETNRLKEMNVEYFKVISDWWHFAILELTYVEGFENNASWIGRYLGIARQEVQAAIERMKMLNLIKEEDGKLIDIFMFLETESDVPSIALKKFHSQLMKKATEALHEKDVLEREISTNIFSFDKRDLPLFKEKIREFKHLIGREANESAKKDSVYCLGIQLFELSAGSIA